MKSCRLISIVLLICTAAPATDAIRAQQAARRSQTPQPPFPYESREVTINGVDGTVLIGTLTIPKGAGPYPAVLLVGPPATDRDATVAGHKPFHVIADYMTRHGLAVLRVDSRKGDHLTFTNDDFANDVQAGLAFLKKRSEINGQKIGLMGHSMGGLIAAAAAAKSQDVAFLVLLASPAIPIREFAQSQRAQRFRAKGMAAEEVVKRLAAASVLYDRLMAGEDNETLRNELREIIKLQLPAELTLTAEQFEGLIQQELATLRSRYYKFLHTYDPRIALKNLKIPLLALNGSLDQVVNARENLAAIENTLSKNGNSARTVVEIYGLNHYFQVAQTGNPMEIAQIEETISPKVLELMTTWIRVRVGM